MFRPVTQSKTHFYLMALLSLALTSSALAAGIFTPILPITQTTDIYEKSPAAVYNPDREEYLVVWFKEGVQYDEIQAQRLDKDGHKIGGPINISSGSGQFRRYPDVAYNSQHQQYLVVWENTTTNTALKSIQFRRISDTGTVLDPVDILLAGNDATFSTFEPAVAYGSGSDNYMVVWAVQDIGLGKYFLYTRKINQDGYPFGSEYKVQEASQYLGNPDIAYDHSNDRHLVVWEATDSSGTLHDIWGCQVYGSGGNYATPFIIDSYPNDAGFPAVAALPNAPGQVKFLVVYEYAFTATDHDIHGCYIEENSAVSGIIFPANASSMETAPAVAASEHSSTFLVAWQEDASMLDKPVKARLFDGAGTYLDGIFELSCALTAFPAAAAGPRGEILVTWSDVPPGLGKTDVFGAIYQELYNAYLPLINH